MSRIRKAPKCQTIIEMHKVKNMINNKLSRKVLLHKRGTISCRLGTALNLPNKSKTRLERIKLTFPGQQDSKRFCRNVKVCLHAGKINNVWHLKRKEKKLKVYNINPKTTTKITDLSQ